MKHCHRIFVLLLLAADVPALAQETPKPTESVTVTGIKDVDQAVTKFVGTTGDVGFAIGKTTAHVISWDPTAVPTSFILSSASTQTGKATEITFY